MKRILTTPIPLYIVIIGLTLVSGIFIGLAVYYRNTFESFSFQFPDADTKTEFQIGSWPALSNMEFFKKIKDQMIQEKTDFIEADLSDMKLRMYAEGQVAGEVDILTKGKPGSWWETPAGIYAVQLKQKNLFSGFGKVYMPWAMQFQGNFFIHGWPYYPGNTPVASQYSGGCIRLATADAKQIYDFVKVGTPVLVYEKDFISGDGFGYEKKMPEIMASSYLAADILSNFVFAEKEELGIRPIASITKLITALISIEYINIEKEITIQDSMVVKTSKPRLRSGQTYSVYDLLHPLLLESSNEAAEALRQ